MPQSARAQETSPAAPISFSSRVERIGTRRIVRLPAETSAQLPSRGQVAVSAVLNGQAFETVIEPDGRRGHWIPLAGKTSEAEGLDAGDTVKGELSLRKEWPSLSSPRI